MKQRAFLTGLTNEPSKDVDRDGGIRDPKLIAVAAGNGIKVRKQPHKSVDFCFCSVLDEKKKKYHCILHVLP
jgi:hypothetical protein